jgi:hypothetical protein
MSVSKAVSWLVTCDGIDERCRADLEFTYGGSIRNQQDVLRTARRQGWEIRRDGFTYCPLHRSRSPEPARELEDWEEA